MKSSKSKIFVEPLKFWKELYLLLLEKIKMEDSKKCILLEDDSTKCSISQASSKKSSIKLLHDEL